MLSSSKKNKLLLALRSYSKKYLQGKITELDESGTRLMINTFLIDVLGYKPIEEVKTEYMIRGTYADYVIQTKETRHFLVEVKALSFELSDKHLRQAINYGANEGIEWALLTNGKSFDFYKVLFNKPIEARKVFAFDLSDISKLKEYAELLQYIHRDSIDNKGLHLLWNKTCALDENNIAGLLFGTPVINFIKKTLKDKFKSKFSDEDVTEALCNTLKKCISLENVKPLKVKKKAPKKDTEGSISTEVLVNQ